ncbi:aldose epimerase family protein [Roseomonas elaeocarpi]|uniref:Aldose epimerase n=1 Tax=Roseomonas elaeocarpi TaxID=907779 RepID=A0ABV6K1L1_9PROT
MSGAYPAAPPSPEAWAGALPLRAGAWEMVLLPAGGAIVASLRHAGRDVLLPVPEGIEPIAAKAGAFPMLPWCNRLDDGWLRWPGGEHRFPRNGAEDNTAIHGLARQGPWRVAEHDGHSARLVQDAPPLLPEDPSQPYRYVAELRFALSEPGLELGASVRNTAAAAMPFGMGWHPWFRRVPGMQLRMRADTALRPDARNMPEAVEPSSGASGPEANWIGLDGAFAGWDGVVEIDMPGLPLELRATGAWDGNFQLFAPRTREVVCLEPVSHVTDVSNRRQLARFGDMRLLAPGESMDAALTLRLRG